MGLLTDDMTRLRDDIDALHNSRETFINDLMHNVSRETFINDLMHNVAEMQSDFRNGHAEMARKGQDDREAFVSDLRSNVAEMQSNFRNGHAEMARKLIDDLRTFVSGLKADVSDMKQGFRNGHAEMARKLIDYLRTFASNLNKTVANLRQEFAADIQGAHRAWFGQSPVERTTRKKARPEQAEVETEEAEELVPDALTAIHGIGAGMQRHLNNAGIYTFAQLARSTPEVVRNALGSLGPMTKVEKWIDHAKELVEPA
jgi:predicted flap endonuclease-1-like 5' DNA nuclease